LGGKLFHKRVLETFANQVKISFEIILFLYSKGFWDASLMPVENIFLHQNFVKQV
jgi:hypothetical protein